MKIAPPIHLYAQLDSTNDVALQSIGTTAAQGTCWVADHQTAGRGRRESGGERRKWFSPPHQNLYFSVLLRPDIEISQASGLTLASAVGVCEAITELTGLKVGIKWPNDIYLNGKKLAGILTEATTTGSELDGMVVGVGLNVNTPVNEIPEELTDIMTSLRIESDQCWDRMMLLMHMRERIVHFADVYSERGFDAIMHLLTHYDCTRDRRVMFARNGATIRGKALGITNQGQLQVQLDTGELHEVNAGEVQFE